MNQSALFIFIAPQSEMFHQRLSAVFVATFDIKQFMTWFIMFPLTMILPTHTQTHKMFSSETDAMFCVSIAVITSIFHGWGVIATFCKNLN